MVKTNSTFVRSKNLMGSLALACLALFAFVGQAAAQTATATWSGSIAIPDNAYNGTLGSMASQAVTIGGIPAGATITDIEVDLGFDHTWIGDVTIKLQAPNGTILGLMSLPGLAETADDGTACCGDSSDSNADAAMAPLTWLDGAAVSAEQMGSTITGTQIVGLADGIFEYAPAPGSIATPPANFAAIFAGLADGSVLNGDWRVYFGDSAGGDVGAMRSVTVRVSYDAAVNPCAGVAINLGSIANLNVTLGATCGARITPAMVLTGDQTCIGNATVTVDGGTTDVIQGCGAHTYMVVVEDQFGNVVYTGWGNINAEDKTPPTIVCAPDTDTADVDISAQLITGALATTDFRINLTDYSCFLELFNPVAGNHYYDLYTFTVNNPTGNAIFTFDVASAWGDATVALFQGAYNPANPCENIIAQNDDLLTGGGFFGSFDPTVRLTAALLDGQTYTLMISSWGANTTGAYSIAVFGENGSISGGFPTANATVTFDLLCTDITQIQFTGDQSYVANADGTINAAATRALRGWSVAQYNAFVAQVEITGFPTVGDNCGGLLVTFSDVVSPAGDCGDVVLNRNFRVRDRYNACQNSAGQPGVALCTQRITFRKPTLDDVILPPFTAPIECDQTFATDGSVGGPDNNPAASFAGLPFLRSAFGFHNLDQNYCNVGASYSDEPRINTCTGSYKFRREWNLIDWCDPGSSIIYNQLIKVGDFTGPAISGVQLTGTPAAIRVSTSPFECLSNYAVPTPTLTDNCSTARPTRYTVLAGGTAFFTNGTYQLVNGVYRANPALVRAPIGDHSIEICAMDACNNETCVTYPFIVRDQIEPTASCDDQLNVSIGGGDVLNGVEGIARVFATDVNEGSYDNCGPVTLEVRRNFWRNNTCDASAARFSPWGDFVDFYCCDIAKEITIELRVTDGSGNQNICWMVVTPEDKLNPFCFAPAPVTLTCVQLPLTFPGDLNAAYSPDNFVATSLMMDALFGAASGTDNCAVDTIVERTPTLNVNECGWGTITRRFEAWQLRPEGDANGNGRIDINEVFRSTNSCSQLITITEVHDFWIDFPADAEADCGTPDIPEVIVNTDGCDVFSINRSEQRFSATGDECYKLGITYDVINWCLWDGEYTGFVITRMTEDDGEALAIDRSVSQNERPIIIYNDANGLTLDRDHENNNGTVAQDQWFFFQPGDDSDILNNHNAGVRPMVLPPNFGRYIYTQFVKVYDTTAPEITVGEYGGPTEACPTLEPGEFGDVTGACTAPVTIPFTIDDPCELFNGAGDQVVTLISANLHAFAVDANRDGVIKANEFVPGASILGNISGNATIGYTFSGTYPIITSAMGDNIFHAIRVVFRDGCGNTSSRIIEFKVLDCKGPAPVCINGLTVTLMPQIGGGCAMAIWASDFEGSFINDCTGQGPDNFLGLPRVTKYAIYRASFVDSINASVSAPFVPNPADTGLVLTDEDEEQTIVYVYAFDEEGNYDFCETYVLVQRHANCAGGTSGGTIAGVIATEAGENVEGVEVNVSGSVSATVVTLGNGAFSFTLPLGGDYSVAPYLNSNYLNGVSTFDLVLMSKHILGVQTLNSPYKLIAADVNNSGSVSTLDMIQLRKLILNIDTEFANNTSWRFIPAGYNFPVASNPWFTEFPEVANFNNFAADQTVGFVGVKIGDVNGSAQANALAGDDRTLNGQFNFNVANTSVKAGNVYTVAFTGADMASVEGFQATLALSGAELVDIEYGVATAENFGTRFAGEGMITTSWNGKATADDVLFSLVIRATVDAELSDVIGVSSRYTAAEAYANGNTANVGINFSNGTVVAAGFEVYQNTPNPFAVETMVSFNLPQDASATITIADASGRVLSTVRGDYAAGYNTVRLTKDMVQGATGVLTYTVTAGEFTATKKMVAVK